MTGSSRVMSRRAFVRDLGHGAVALAVVGLAACSREARGSFDPLTYTGNLEEIESFWCEDRPPDPPLHEPSDPTAPGSLSWARVGARWASGYVLVRSGEATVIDTGPWCTADFIEAGLQVVGVDWSAVGSVIVTHKHPDHWVGLSAMAERAAGAVVFAGAADIPHIASPRPIVPVGAGDRVMDLAIIPTPGHTPGHIAVHDEVASVLVVGDAVVGAGDDNRIAAPPSGEDMAGAQASARTLAGLSFETLLPGHGEPIIGGGWDALVEYLDAG